MDALVAIHEPRADRRRGLSTTKFLHKTIDLFLPVVITSQLVKSQRLSKGLTAFPGSHLAARGCRHALTKLSEKLGNCRGVVVLVHRTKLASLRVHDHQAADLCVDGGSTF